MATLTKGQRPRPKPRVVLPPEAAYNHSAFPASTQFKGIPFFGTGSPFLEGKTFLGTGSAAFEGKPLFGADSTQVEDESLFDTGNTQVKEGSLFGASSTQVKDGSLFGASSTQAKGGSLFANAGSTQVKGGSLFANAGSTQVKEGSLFGASSTQVKDGSLFDASSTQAKGGSLFANAGSTQAKEGSLFGASSTQVKDGSLFGANSTQAKGGSLFANASSTQAKGGSLFGVGNTQVKGESLFGVSSTQVKGKLLFSTSSIQAKDGSLFGIGNTQVKGKSLFSADSTPSKGFGTRSTQVEREPLLRAGSTSFKGFGTGSTQSTDEPLCGTGSSSPLPQVDPSGHPDISIDSGSDSELPTTVSCPSLPSPSTSSPLTSTSSLTPFPTRSAITTCEGGNGGHQRSVSAGIIPTHKRTEQAPPGSRAGRSKSQGADPVRNINNLGETRGDSGASDVEASLADNPQQLVFTRVHEKERSSSSIAHAVFAKLLKVAFKISDQQKPEKINDWGSIYILQNPRHPKYVKIGRTRYGPDERLQQWVKCECPLNLVEAPEDCFIRVPCHTRLEILIHAMLWNERRQFACRHCTAKSKKNIPADGKVSKHDEWFEIDKEHALRLVKLGRDWMRSRPYGDDGELTKHWKNRVTRIRNDIKDFTQILETEIEEGRRWEAFLTMPNATRLSRIQQWVWDKRLEPNGRLSPSRSDAFWKHKQTLFVFCVLHYLGIVMLSWYCYSSAAPYMFMLATLSSAAFAL